ncbi:unnamed protein product, partial [Chrysoparadoxa australica]
MRGRQQALNQLWGKREKLSLAWERTRRGRLKLNPKHNCSSQSYDSVGEHSKIDCTRQARTGIPEVIYGQGKSITQIREIFAVMGK